MVFQLDEFLKKLNIDAISNNSNYIGEIFHYTALKNIEPILLNSQNKIVLRASQFDCLNDISEGTIVEQCYYEVCNNLKNDGRISEKLYNLLSSIKPSPNETFIISQDGKLKKHRGEYTTYILSFSKNNDILPMWNYYSKGDMFEGINLGVNTEKILSNFPQSFADGKAHVSVNSVVYLPEEQKQIIKEFLLNIIKNYDEQFNDSVRAIVSMKLTSWKMLFKKEYFSHEQEVRIIVNIANKYKDVLPVKYRTNSGYIIPYIELKISKDTLKSVTLGPFRGTKSQIALQKRTLYKMLESNQYNVDEENIRESEVPVRY